MAVPPHRVMWQVHFEFPYIAELTIFIRNKMFMFHTQTNGRYSAQPKYCVCMCYTAHRIHCGPLIPSSVCVYVLHSPQDTVAHSSSPVCVCVCVTRPTGYTVAHSSSPVYVCVVHGPQDTLWPIHPVQCPSPD